MSDRKDPLFRAMARAEEALEVAVERLERVEESYENEFFAMGDEPWDLKACRRNVEKKAYQSESLRREAGLENKWTVSYA